MLQLGEVVRHDQPFGGGRAPIHLVRIAIDRHPRHRFRDALHLDRDHHHRRPPEHDARIADHLHAPDPRNGGQLARHRRRKSNRPHDDVLRRQDEQVRIERRVHPIDDRVVAGARHAGECDDERERQHQRGDARRRPARRLNQAVCRQRTFHRAHPLEHRPQRARERQREQRAEKERHEDREAVPDVEHRPRSSGREAHDRDQSEHEREDRAQAALAGRQHLILPLLQRLNRIDASGVHRGNRGRDHARRDADRNCNRQQARRPGDFVRPLSHAVHVIN